MRRTGSNSRKSFVLEADTVDRPNIQWVFEGYSTTDIKVVLDHQPLLGTGPLPDWLRNLAQSGRGRAMAVLDTYQDNLCLCHCVVVFYGSRPERSTYAARLLARNYFFCLLLLLLLLFAVCLCYLFFFSFSFPFAN